MDLCDQKSCLQVEKMLFWGYRLQEIAERHMEWAIALREAEFCEVLEELHAEYVGPFGILGRKRRQIIKMVENDETVEMLLADFAFPKPTVQPKTTSLYKVVSYTGIPDYWMAVLGTASPPIRQFLHTPINIRCRLINVEGLSLVYQLTSNVGFSKNNLEKIYFIVGDTIIESWDFPAEKPKKKDNGRVDPLTGVAKTGNDMGKSKWFVHKLLGRPDGIKDSMVCGSLSIDYKNGCTIWNRIIPITTMTYCGNFKDNGSQFHLEALTEG